MAYFIAIVLMFLKVFLMIGMGISSHIHVNLTTC